MTSQNSTQYSSLLNQSISDAARLLDILEKEFSLLVEKQFESLPDLLTEKQAFIRNLEEKETCRNKIILEAGKSADKAGHIEYINENDNDGSLAKVWESFIDVISKCQKANQKNAAIVARNQINIKQLLDIFTVTHDDVNRNTSTYTASGDTKSDSSGHEISQA